MRIPIFIFECLCRLRKLTQDRLLSSILNNRKRSPALNRIVCFQSILHFQRSSALVQKIVRFPSQDRLLSTGPFDDNTEFWEFKRVFCSVFLSGSVKTILRAKWSFGVILVIFGHFCKIEKARISAISWADKDSI